MIRYEKKLSMHRFHGKHKMNLKINVAAEELKQNHFSTIRKLKLHVSENSRD